MANVKGYLGKKNPVTIGMIAVLAVALVAAIFGAASIEGYATYTAIEFKNLTVPIKPIYVTTVFDHSGWGACNDVIVNKALADKICVDLGYSRAADRQPCLHEWAPTRYHWMGMLPTDANEYLHTKAIAGYALTGVRCV